VKSAKLCAFFIISVVFFTAFVFAADGIGVSASVPSVKLYSLHEFKKASPKKGAYYLEGYVVKVYTCPECPKGAQCKPCMEDNIVVSEYNRPLVDYSQVGKSEIIVFVRKPQVFKLGRKYKFLVGVTNSKSTLEPINDLELISYSVLN